MKEKSKTLPSNRQVQSSIFISSLRNSMDKMSTTCKKNEMVKAAHQYISTGMSRKETEELLILDGYEPSMAQNLMKSANFSEEFHEDTDPRWSFEIEDTHGRIYSSSEFGITIVANSEEEAQEKAEIEIEKYSTIELDSILNLKKV